jgi:small conductance mechanosensitive channel
MNIKTHILDKTLEKLNEWKDGLLLNLPNIAIATVVLILTYFISKSISSLVEKSIGKKIGQRSVRNLVSRFASGTVVLFGIYFAMTILKFDGTLKTIISAAGISGLVIGLALQGTLSNVISGIVLSFRKNLNLGNWVETSGFSGEVIDINLNYFVVKEADNNMVIIPNKTILDNAFKNYSLTTEMRISVSCGVEYGADLEAVKALTIKTISNRFDQKKFKKEVEFFYTEFADSSINFLCRFWVNAEQAIDKLNAESTAIIEIKKAFDQAGVNIPFPIRTIDFSNRLNLSKTKEEL